jgi:colanic acid biosynthesis protein WcaH
MPPAPLSLEDLRSVIRLAPLVSIDLVIRNRDGAILLGLRNNEPAKDTFFVPGGMIRKDERLAAAFARILRHETNFTAPFESARLLGAYEHFYANNRFADGDYGTHYVVLGYELRLDDTSGLTGDDQHGAFRWWDERDLLASDRVHPNTKAYFRRPD